MKWIQNKVINSMIVFSYIALELQTQIKVIYILIRKSTVFCLDKNDRLWILYRNHAKAVL